MATRNSKTPGKGGKIAGVPANENLGHSNKGIPGVTGNRKTSERIVGSGNTRRGAIEARKAAGESGRD